MVSIGHRSFVRLAIGVRRLSSRRRCAVSDVVDLCRYWIYRIGQRNPLGKACARVIIDELAENKAMQDQGKSFAERG